MKYLKKTEEFFNDFEKMIEKQIETKLRPLIKEKKFKAEIAEVDNDIKMYLKDMYSQINKEIEELTNDLKELMKNVLNDLECDLNQQKFTAIQDMASNYLGIGLASISLIGGGLTMGIGVGYASSALIAIEAGVGASIGIPIAGIVVGALAVIGGTGYLLWRWFRDETKFNDKLLKKFRNRNKEEIDKSQKKIKGIIEDIVGQAEEKVTFYYGIARENLDSFRKNKELFEKYYIEYENIMINSFNL